MAKKVVLNVTPDRLDLRDRPYLPAVALAPPPALRPARLPVPLDQGESSACTGFALAALIEHLLSRSGRAKDAVSPWMLYSMARRYDEFPGVADDAGSSLRGALKGWYRHGACALALWKGLEMPRQREAAGEDWWLDAVNRPLGAYYRVDMRSVTDMHVALNEVGALYASALTHDGWFEAGGGVIPMRRRKAADGGHAFAIVGYDQAGFLVRNSWGKSWGKAGYATLSYEDWLENAMDCWVAQVGVVTDEHRRVAAAALPSTAPARTGAALSPDRVLQNHQLAPFVIDMEDDGRLSRSGAFRTQEEDVRALAHEYLDAACREWRIGAGKPIDIAVYAHGGLTSEAEAAATFARWMPALVAARVFPVFLMWESDLWSTIAHRFAQMARMAPPAGGPLESLGRWWNERLEGLLAPVGTALWDEMKENAAALSAQGSGARIFFEELARSPAARRHPPRLHLIGHSAGAIAHAFLVDRLAALEWEFESVHLMAPAITVDRFEERVLPWLGAGHVKRYRQYHLTDAAELTDPTTRALLGYGRSLLYLVSRAFEGGGEARVLGMERHFPAALARRRNVKVFVAPSQATAATTHGAFDTDSATMRSVISGLDS